MVGNGVKLSVGLSGKYTWPNGKPVDSEILSSGQIVYTLEDGRKIGVDKPVYRVEYLSTWLGAALDETYDISVALIGLSKVEGFYEVWNFDIGEVRNYAFSKTKRIVDIETGCEFTSEELQSSLTSL